MTERRLSPLDKLLARADNALRTLTPGTIQAERTPAHASPAPDAPEPDSLYTYEHHHVRRLMLLNNTAQMLTPAPYQRLPPTTSSPPILSPLEDSSREH